MTIPKGSNLVSGERLSFQQINRIKNAFRLAGIKVEVDDAQLGMALSDSDDNRRYHVVSVGGSTIFFEILQAEVMVCMDNEIVCFDNEPVTMPVI